MKLEMITKNNHKCFESIAELTGTPQTATTNSFHHGLCCGTSTLRFAATFSDMGKSNEVINENNSE